MPKIFIKSKLHSNKRKLKVKPELKNNKSNLPPKLQAFKQNLL